MVAIGLLFALCQPAAAQRFTFDTFGYDQGLTNVALNCVKQGRDGFVLACTEHGLFIHNGRRFKNLDEKNGLPDGGQLWALAIDPAQRVFVAFSNAIYMSRTGLDPRSSPTRMQFRHFLAKKNVQMDTNREIVAWNGGAVVRSDGNLLFADPADGSVGLLGDRPGFSALAALGPHVRFLTGSGDRLWISLDDGRLCSIRTQGAVGCFDKRNNLPDQQWYGLLEATDGSLWARSDNIIVHLPAGQTRFEIDSIPGDPGRYLGHEDRLQIRELPDGRVITQGNDALLMLGDHRWTILDGPNGVPAATLSGLMIDVEGNLWLAVRGVGLARTIGTGFGNWLNFDHRDGLSDNVVWQIATASNQQAFIATEKGLDALDSAGDRPRIGVITTSSTYITLCDRLGRVWHATGGRGLYRSDPRDQTIRFFETPPVFSATQGPDGVLWFGTADGVYTIDSTQPESVPVRIPDIVGQVKAVAAENGSAWVLVHSSLWHVSRGRTQRISVNWGEPDFDPNEVALDGPGRLWVGGTTGHLLKLSLRGDHATVEARIGQPPLISTAVVSLFTDRRGWLWVGTDSGLSVFDGSRWTAANMGTGLIWNDINQGAITEGQDGSMWFGTSGGLSHLMSPRSLFDRRPPMLLITDATVGDKPAGTKRLAYGRQPLMLRFGTLNFMDRGAIRYRYRLDGLDEGWVETTIPEARYPFLPSGHHQFQVVAFNSLTGLSSPPCVLDLSMAFPWWRSWWFEALVPVCLLLAGYGVLRLRTRYLLFRQKQLQELIDLRTQEIRAAQAALLLQATRDSLTGLPNRAEIQRRLQEWLLPGPKAHTVCVGLLDLDHFKSINDRFGHLAGDDVLQEMGRRLAEHLDGNEVAGRYGGEEFVVLLAADGVHPLARWHRLKAILTDEPFLADGRELSVTCSVGISCGIPGESWQTVISRADKALYSAKARGRNRVVDADFLKAS
ncbi:diguanylate cyclase [Rhizosaccharibacter radicis]|uniref:diguanylate cyclase n=1 Tax=Rhizosaccharibacter radicis TaxID=2782605 RepID=A0ABT1VTL6_9PROT|nr:diguanylate cyclase [Acetobacteraceae bacterium KSS12]